MKLIFVGSKLIASDVKSFIFKSDKPISWTAGQFIYYTLVHPSPDDRGTRRWFTIAAPPSKGEIMITTRILSDKGSSFKHALNSLKPGDAIEANEPEGDFTLTDISRNYVFIAGGIGITPYYSILTEAAIKNQKLKVHLVYANRTDDISFKSELDELSANNPDLKIDYVIEPNRIDDKLLNQLIKETDNPLIYISGPEPMVEALTDQIIGLGVPKDSVKSDYFPGYKADLS